MNNPYIGRFAPSPSGPLHFGSLATAMGSYLQARSQNGQWLLRIEDIDPPREVSGAGDAIIRSLENLGFEWDQSITWQHNNLKRYAEALQQLQTQGLLFACACSRKQLANTAASDSHLRPYPPGPYPGTCRARSLSFTERSIRIRVQGDIHFHDAVQGHVSESLAEQIGDFIVKRRDGLFAYQLAVVIDDADQGITEVVRGADLLDNTARQIFLQRALNAPTPDYCHLPIALDKNGKKLCKHTHAEPIDTLPSLDALLSAWHFLGQASDTSNSHRQTPDSVKDFWPWAIANWSLTNVPLVHKQ